MRNYMISSAIAFFTLASASGADDKSTVPQSLNGAWTVVCLEKNGQPQAESKGMTVKADAGTFTCSGRDGKQALTLKLAFGPNGTVQVTESTGDTSTPTAARAGVYVLTEDILAISINNDVVQPGADAKPASDNPTAKSRCSVILKREGARIGGDK